MENVDEKSYLIVTQDAVTLAKTLHEVVAAIMDTDANGASVLVHSGYKNQLADIAHKILTIDAVKSMCNAQLMFPDYPSEFGTYQRNCADNYFGGIEQLFKGGAE